MARSPVYAEQIGMSVTDVVTFVSVSIIGGALVQYPLGHLSDLWDRRKVLLLASCGALVAALALVHVRRQQPARHLSAGLRLRLVCDAAVFAVGRACQRPGGQGRVRPGQRGADAVLLLRRHWRPVRRIAHHAAAGSAAGCSSSSPASTSIFIVIILYRMRARSSVPRQQRGRFIALLRTSTMFARLTRKTGSGERK